MDNYLSISCVRCYEHMERFDYIANEGVCDACKDAHLDSLNTDHLGMGEWNGDDSEEHF